MLLGSTWIAIVGLWRPASAVVGPVVVLVTQWASGRDLDLDHRPKLRRARHRGTISGVASSDSNRLDHDGHFATGTKKEARLVSVHTHTYIHTYIYKGTVCGGVSHLIIVINPPVPRSIGIVGGVLPQGGGPVDAPAPALDPAPAGGGVLDLGQLEVVPRRHGVALLVGPGRPLVREQAVGPAEPHPPPLVLVQDEREPHAGRALQARAVALQRRRQGRRRPLHFAFRGAAAAAVCSSSCFRAGFYRVVAVE